MAILTVPDDAVGEITEALKTAKRTVRGAQNTRVQSNSEGVVVATRPPIVPTPGQLKYNGSVIAIKNESGGDLVRFNILGIDDAYYDPSTEENLYYLRRTLKGTTPADPDHIGKFAILLQDIDNNAVGRALVMGVTAVKINVVSEADEFADIEDANATRLKSGGGGLARILHVESGTGEKWGIIVMGGSSAPATSYVKVTANPTSGQRTYQTKVCKKNGDWPGDPPTEPTEYTTVDCSGHMWGPMDDTNFGLTHCFPLFQQDDVIPVKSDSEGNTIPDLYFTNTYKFDDPDAYIGTVYPDSTDKRLRQSISDIPKS